MTYNQGTIRNDNLFIFCEKILMFLIKYLQKVHLKETNTFKRVFLVIICNPKPSVCFNRKKINVHTKFSKIKLEILQQTSHKYQIKLITTSIAVILHQTRRISVALLYSVYLLVDGPWS